MFHEYQKQQQQDIVKPITKLGEKMTPEQERRHRALSDALGMTWQEYLECNPHLKN